jgi:hypothetical protein
MRSSFMVSGLDETMCMEQSVRAALVQAVTAQLSGATKVRLLRIAVSDTVLDSESEEHRSARTKVEFEIEPIDAVLTALDRIEAELILLASSRRAAASFDLALQATLLASGALPPNASSSWHAVFGEAQQFTPQMVAAAMTPAHRATGVGDRRLHGIALPEFV